MHMFASMHRCNYLGICGSDLQTLRLQRQQLVEAAALSDKVLMTLD